jgi:phospholipid/cholesterol/gamma-HCH transport system substrate-binding protein
MRKAIAGVQHAADNLDAMITDARPGIQNFSKNTLPQANALVRDLRELSTALTDFTERVDQGGISSALGPQKLPDYKPRDGR